MNAITFSAANTTSNLTDTAREYVSQFNTFLNKSAEAVLEMGRIVFEAKDKLDKNEFPVFCAAIRLNAEGSAISKLKTIGGRYSTLSQYKDVLPNAWTTLYYLAKLSEEDFNRGLQQQLIHQTMTANELKAINPKIIPSKRAAVVTAVEEAVESTPSNDIRIKLGDLVDEATKALLIAKLRPICDEYGFQLVVGE
jgi:hypothetical protein